MPPRTPGSTASSRTGVRCGLPATGINWGPWADVGRAQFFADLGFSMITAEQGIAAMQLVLAADRARTGVFSLDARQWFQSFPAAERSSLFAKLARLDDGRAPGRRTDPGRTRRRGGQRASGAAGIRDRRRDPGGPSLDRSARSRPGDGVARPRLADGPGTAEPAEVKPGHRAAGGARLGLPDHLRVWPAHCASGWATRPWPPPRNRPPEAEAELSDDEHGPAGRPRRRPASPKREPERETS